MIEIYPRETQISIVQEFPDIDKASPIITLTHEEAVKLAEDLLVAVHTQNFLFQKQGDSLPERIASHMWNNSTIRHGLFTPPQFSRIAEMSIREFFHKPDPEGASPPGEKATTND